VTVVVPFLGNRAEAAAIVGAVSTLELRPGDEVLIADNAPAGSLWPALPAGIEVVPAPGVRSSYHARNVAAARAGGEWILFLDADCRPSPTLLDDYLAPPIPPGVALLAGEVEGVAGDDGIAARWLVARRHLAVAPQLARGSVPLTGTANLMVRRTAWEELGGFAEVRSGADYELCLRAAAAGWGLEYRPRASVTHVHSGDLREALARARRYGAGQAWIYRLHPGAATEPAPARAAARAAAGWVWWTLTTRFERGAFKAIDGAWEAAFAWGWHRGSNAPEA
jgi:GT2 family glycosyltransferase